MEEKEWKKKLGTKYLFHNVFNIGFTLILYKLFGFEVALLALVASISTDVGEIMKYIVSTHEEK